MEQFSVEDLDLEQSREGGGGRGFVLLALSAFLISVVLPFYPK